MDESPILDTSPIEQPRSRHGLKKKKIIIICVLAALVILAAVSIFVLFFFNSGNKNPMFNKGIDGMYGNTKTYIYYPIDYSYDIMSDTEYLGLDRRLYYKSGGETIAVDEYPIEDFDSTVAFFVEYFKLAISGDYNAYNALFTENYYKANEPYYSFTQQMIYDMEIEKLSEKTENGNTYYYYNVSYKIHKNNGTFRNDIGSDGEKTLHFTLVEKDGKILIDSITYYLF